MILQRTVGLLMIVVSTLIPVEVCADDQYIITLQIFVITNQKFEFKSQNVVTGEDVTSVGGVYSMRIGDLQADLEADNLWNGEFEPPEGSGIELLSAPQIVTEAGKKAQLQSASMVQYLEKRGDDCFVVQALPLDASPGIFMEMTASEGVVDDDGIEMVDFDVSLRVATIQEREPVPGLDLDVGRPVIRSKQISSRYRYRLDRWNVIASQMARDDSSSDKETLVVLLRVKRPPV